jgi:hypothetical protein
MGRSVTKSPIFRVTWDLLEEGVNFSDRVEEHHTHRYNAIETIGFEQEVSKTRGLHMDARPDALGVLYVKSWEHSMNFHLESLLTMKEYTTYDFGDRSHVVDIVSLLYYEEVVEYAKRRVGTKLALSMSSLLEDVTYNLRLPLGRIAGDNPYAILDLVDITTDQSMYLSIGETVEYLISTPDSMVYDTINDIWLQYANMKITHANVLDGGNASNNVNLLVRENGKIHKFPSNVYTDDISIVSTKVVGMRKGVVQSFSVVGTNQDEKGATTIYVGNFGKEDSIMTGYRLEQPIKMRAKHNPIPKDAGYGTSFFAQIKNLFSIRNIVFKFKTRIKDSD